MKPINFKQSNITFAQDHPKYGVLPALKYGEKGHVVSCWKLSFKESICVLFLGKIWIRLTVFDGPLAPTLLTTNKKEVFPTPSITPLKGKDKKL